MSVTRRRAMLGAASGLVAIAAGTQAATSGTARRARPNILWLVSEDNNPYIGAYGDNIAHTPNIDALARKGVLFRHVYSSAPVCAPSRFGILTGIYPESCAPAQNMRANAHLPAGLETYPQLMRKAGYHCTNNSKTDYNCDVSPAAIWDESSDSAHWRSRPDNKPFLSVFNYFTTHESRAFEATPGRVKPADVRVPAYLPDTPEIRDGYASYYNLMEKMDAQVGERLAELEADGLAEDTIVFYYSDNGGVLPRSKRYCYDEGLRVSMVVYFPPKWAHLAPGKPGSEYTGLVSLLDLAPTLLSIIDEPKPAHMQGNAFAGARAAPPQVLAFGMRNRMDERYDCVRTVTDGRYRYIRNYMPHRPWEVHGAFEWQQKSYQDWEREYLAGKLTPVQSRFFQSKPYEELYDLQKDRDEIENLASDPHHATTLQKLSAALSRHMLAIHDNGFIPEGAAAEGYYASRSETAYPLKAVMSLAEMAARREPRNLDVLREHLKDTNEVMRYWSALGLLMLGADAMPAKAEIERAATHDASLYVQVVAAESLAHLGQASVAITKLASVLDRPLPFPVRLYALNALTFLGTSARAALPEIKRAAVANQEYLRGAGRYLEAVLEGTYTPTSQIFDNEFFRKNAGAGTG